jgi:hypothetical protein
MPFNLFSYPVSFPFLILLPTFPHSSFSMTTLFHPFFVIFFSFYIICPLISFPILHSSFPFCFSCFLSTFLNLLSVPFSSSFSFLFLFSYRSRPPLTLFSPLSPSSFYLSPSPFSFCLLFLILVSFSLYLYLLRVLLFFNFLFPRLPLLFSFLQPFTFSSHSSIQKPCLQSSLLVTPFPALQNYFSVSKGCHRHS